MKSLLLAITSLLTVSSVSGQTWTWSSASPKASEIVNVDITNFDLTNHLHMVSFSFNGKNLVTNDVFFQQDKDGAHVSLLVPAETHWIRLAIRDENNQVVAADDKPVSNQNVQPGVNNIEQAMAMTTYARFTGLKRDNTKAISLISEAVKADPAWMDNPDVLTMYAEAAKGAKSLDDVNMIKTHITSFNSKKINPSAPLLVSAVRISKTLGDTSLSMTLRKKTDREFPQSQLKQEDQLAIVVKAKTPEEKISLRNRFKSTYGLTDDNKTIYDNMTMSIIESFAAKEDWTKVEIFINELASPGIKAAQENEYAWTLSGEDVDNKALNAEMAARLSSASLKALTPDLNKPFSLSKNEWISNLDFMRSQYGDTYALILYKLGKYNEAVDHQAFSVKTTHYEQPDMNERFVIYMDKAGQKDELVAFVDQMIESGNATEKMKEIHKRIWMTEKTPDQLYNRYVASLEEKAKAKKLEEIKAMWMEDATASAFTLKNLKGEDVSLSDFKGKTVVIDFWATWCGPCKASFPGMKKVVENYAQDHDVVFLFVDTWENGENIPDRVGKFISDNNYPFPVLLDNKNAIVENFKVEGIPTKFIIDKDQKIRFKAVGFSGNTDELVEELTTMIEMTQNGGNLQKS